MQIGYTDASKRRRRASPEGLLAVLEVLGATVRSMADVPDAIRDRERAPWSRPVEPVTVAWEGEGALEVTLPHPATKGLQLELTLDGGEAWPFPHASLTASPWRRIDVDGMAFAQRTFPLMGLPYGYHRVDVRSGSVGGSAVVISAPRRCASVKRREWGAFMPLYAVRSARNWGCGDVTDLSDLSSWMEGLGGSTLGTLPLLAAFLDEPFEPSPYSPVSRLFWNDLYVDVERVPELRRSDEARTLISSPAFQREIEAARRSRLVAYRAVAALKRRVLTLLARAFASAPPARRRELERRAASLPLLDDYAAFRATAERHRAGWLQWPHARRNAALEPEEVDPEARDYHRYVQLVTEEQLADTAGGPEVASGRRGAGRGLYMDLPLGVDPAGYDTWRYRDAFALGVSGGAPPDMFFAKGQEWGFPPMHPDGAREDGYTYYRAVVRNLLRHAGALRIDHVMGLHRMYWVPPGLDPRFGVYVRYRPEELYAILALESHRAGAAIVGEDLGTVPPSVRSAMARHGVLRSYVLQLAAMKKGGVPEPTPASLASLNTHDMPPFRAYWEGLDIDDRLGQGLLDQKEGRAEVAERARQRRALARTLREAGFLRGRAAGPPTEAALRYLAAAPSTMMMVNLEDLWGETEPQNRPGTGPEQRNWSRKAARTMSSIRSDPAIAGTLEEIDRLRRQRGHNPEQRHEPIRSQNAHGRAPAGPGRRP